MRYLWTGEEEAQEDTDMAKLQERKCMETSPVKGVTLKSGILKEAFERNQEYLMKHFTLDDLVYPFRIRSGKEGRRDRPLAFFWETDLEGSNAGRFLMGAGHSLLYCENQKLRERMNALVKEIADCAEEDGYCMGFAKEDMMILERANYTRSWLTRGLLAAYAAGNEEAGRVVRRFQDWFNSYAHRRKCAELHLSYQGMIADTQMALSALGKEEDRKRTEELYADAEWIKKLTEGDTTTIWKHANDGAHGYELNAMISYLELAILSGDSKYYEGVKAAWELFRKYWIHIGGSVAICEEHDSVFHYAPGSRHVTADWHTGETCNNVWWILLNQLLLSLNPDEEKYAAEIEKSVYNVVIPAQEGSAGIRYHANLHGRKDAAYAENTCCEGTGTMLYGMLPSLVYRMHTQDSGVTVQLFADSELEYTPDGVPCKIVTETKFPADENVKLTVKTEKAVAFPLRIRIPGWISEDMAICCDGVKIAEGKAGSYVTVERVWQGETSITFTLHRRITCERYFGFSTVSGYERYVLMEGPILLAVTGPETKLTDCAVGWADMHPQDERSAWNHTHWIMDADPENPDSFFSVPGFTVKPYYQVKEEELFTCYPIVPQKAADHALTPAESFATGLRYSVDCGGVKMELAGIVRGEFLMGQEGFEPCERPVHKETVEKDFFMSVYPVTQEQYEAVMGSNPSDHKMTGCPVENVTYYDAKAFVEKLNELQDEVTFRLPTEKEWEYACRAGSRDINGYSCEILRNFSQYMWNYQQLGIQAVETNSLPTSHPVGRKIPNTWGLYDMLGNVGEWCEDVYRSYEENGFEEPGLRVIRGGSYTDLATYCRCATRNALEPEWKNRFTGFRVAAEPKK